MIFSEKLVGKLPV